MLALAVQHAAAAPAPSEAGARYLARLGEHGLDERAEAEASGVDGAERGGGGGGGGGGGEGGRSLAECLVRLDAAAQLPASQRALLGQLIRVATEASAPLAAHVARSGLGLGLGLG